MKPRAHDPDRLDVAAFAAEGACLAGQWPGSRMTRLAQSQSPPQDTQPGPIEWHARGELRPVRAGEPEVWLHLRAQTMAWLACQRCLQPVEQRVEVDCRIRFVRDEAQAEALDAELEDDVLAMPRRLDLAELVEDELLLALPLVPRHEVCPQPLMLGTDGTDSATGAGSANPFAVLRDLRRRPGEGPGRS